jgi:hypothetical protein
MALPEAERVFFSSLTWERKDKEKENIVLKTFVGNNLDNWKQAGQ